MTAPFDTQTYKVRDNDGKYLGFDFVASVRGGQMNPLWGAISCSYRFTQEEATRLARVHKAHIVPKLVWEADQAAFDVEVARRKAEFDAYCREGRRSRR